MTGNGLMGRESALVGLRRAVDEAVAGRGRLELIAGEAGIGKTSLAVEVVAYAEARGLGVLWGACWDGEGAPPYWPWVQVLRAHRAGEGTPPTFVSLEAEVARIMPELAGSTGIAGRSMFGDGARERFDLFNAVASLLTREARTRPLLVVLDDLQWADVPSLLLLDFLARQLVSAPLLVLGTFRDEEVSGDETRRELLGRARGNGEVVALTGLAATDVGQLMGAVAGVRPPAGLASEVFRRTGGNPFFVRELTQLLVSRGELGDDAAASGGIPDGVRQVVTQRLARLPQACVSILTVAAVVGRETGSDLLVRVTAEGHDSLAEQLDHALRARVLVRPSGMAGFYRFAHDLFREVVYDGLSTSIRAELHLRIARALQDSQAEGSVIHDAALAHHLLLAATGMSGTPELGDEAARYGVLAAEAAIARLAYEDAVAHIQRQLDGLGPAGLLREPARLELLLCRADALRCAGQLVAAQQDYGQAIDLARRLREPTQLGRAALGVHALGVESGASRAACVALLDDALDQLPDEDSALKARVLASLARELFLSGIQERTRAAWLSAQAVETARRVGEDAALAVCLLASHDTIWLPGMAGRRRAIAVEMGAVARRAGDRAFEAEACLLQASAGLELADPAAIVDLEEFARLGMAVGQPRYTYLALTRRAALAIMRGRFVEAERLIDEATALGEAIDEPDAWNVQTRLLWDLRNAQGRRVDAEAGLRTVQLPQLGLWFDAMLGLVLLERGQRAEALRMISAAVQTRPEHLALNYVLMVQWAELGEAAAAAGLLEACGRYYDAMRPHSGTAVVTAAAVGFAGAVDHHLGKLAAALGRADDAVGHLERAATLHERLSAWPWLARTRCELAVVLAARGLPGDGDRVTTLLDDVRQAAEDFDIPGLLGRVAAIGLPPVNVFRRDGDGWHVVYGGQEVRLRNVKGLGDIATLLRAPGRGVPAVQLAAGESASPLVVFEADPILDRRAQKQYRTRLGELENEIDTAQAQHDLARAAALVDEREFLVRELSAAVGIGHRDRRLGDDRERARKAVAGRIKDALNRIEAVHPALGAHLSEAISTGTLCVYQPTHPTRWGA